MPRDLNLPHAKVVKLKEENLMYSAMREKEVQEQKESLEICWKRHKHTDKHAYISRKDPKMIHNFTCFFFSGCGHLRLIQEMPEGEIPNGTKVDINGLQSEAAKWMNGQKVGY